MASAAAVPTSCKPVGRGRVWLWGGEVYQVAPLLTSITARWHFCISDPIDSVPQKEVSLNQLLRNCTRFLEVRDRHMGTSAPKSGPSTPPDQVPVLYSSSELGNNDRLSSDSPPEPGLPDVFSLVCRSSLFSPGGPACIISI